MPEVDNLDVMKNVVNALISITERKTDQGHAIMTMDTLIKQLEPQFNFLKNIHIREKPYSEYGEIVSIMTDINEAKPMEVAKAIHALIVMLHDSLGDSSGHFFIKEIKQMLGDENISRMKKMGVDFSLMQLDEEFTHMKKLFTHQKT